jgi:hypothetical protein
MSCCESFRRLVKPPQRPWTRRERAALWLARRWGWYRYDGLIGRHPSWWPLARVWYPPGNMLRQGAYSVNMPIGHAVDYAEIYGGIVVPRS